MEKAQNKAGLKILNKINQMTKEVKAVGKGMVKEEQDKGETMIIFL